MKKVVPFLALTLIASLLGGCNRNTTPPATTSSSASESETISQSESMEPEISQIPETSGANMVEDDNAKLTLNSAKDSYTMDEIIDLECTVENKGDQTMVYVVGSGSSIVPDALQIQLGSLVPLFYPEIETMDYQTGLLKPGETATFKLPFAPFNAPEDTRAFGTDKDIAYFRDNDFEQAAAGDVTGKITLGYFLQDAAAEEIMNELDDESKITLSLDYSVNLQEQAESAPAE